MSSWRGPDGDLGLTRVLAVRGNGLVHQGLEEWLAAAWARQGRVAITNVSWSAARPVLVPRVRRSVFLTPALVVLPTAAWALAALVGFVRAIAVIVV